MPKRNLKQNRNDQCPRKKVCYRFKEEWLREFIETDMPSVPGKLRVVLRDIYVYNNENGEVVCTMCKKARTRNE